MRYLLDASDCLVERLVEMLDRAVFETSVPDPTLNQQSLLGTVKGLCTIGRRPLRLLTSRQRIRRPWYRSTQETSRSS
jgi:hypothetical protein